MSEEFTHTAYLCLQSPTLEDGELLAMAHYGWVDQRTGFRRGSVAPAVL